MKKMRVLTFMMATGTALTVTGQAFHGSVEAETITNIGDASILQGDMENEVKKLIMNLSQEGIDYVAGLVPCGSWLAKPLSFAIGKVLDPEDDIKNKDLLKEINTKFDEISGQINAVSVQINDLSIKLDEKTGILATRIKDGFNLASLREDIKALNYDINEVFKDIEDIAERKDAGQITAEQATVELADLYKATRMDDLKFRIYNLRNSMSRNGSMIYADFYKTIFDCYAEDYMFSGEFFDRAKKDADALTSQYLMGCGLLVTCQMAVPEISNFTAEQIASLGSTHYSIYSSVMQKGNRLQMDIKDTVNAINAATDGYRSFYEGYHENRYVNFGLDNRIFKSKETEVIFSHQLRYDHDLPGSYPGRYTTEDEMKKIYQATQDHLNSIYFTPALMKRITDYIRTTYPGRSIRDVYMDISGADLSGKYMIIDTKITETRTGHTTGSWGGTGSQYAVSMKGIDVDDPNCKVVDVTFCRIGKGWFAGRNAYNEAQRAAYYNGIYSISNFSAETDDKFMFWSPVPEVFNIRYGGSICLHAEPKITKGN